MTDIQKLLNQLASQESQLKSTQFLAPCVQGNQVRTKVSGIVYSFTAKPIDFVGWGIFQPQDDRTACLAEEASLPQIGAYLNLLPAFRLRLAYALGGQTWLAYPVNEADFRQRLNSVKPVAVHLVTDGAGFEQVIARWDGRSWWFDQVDRRADLQLTEMLRSHLKAVTPLATLQFKGLTPEMRSVYELVAQQTAAFQVLNQQQRDEERLRKALQVGGGELRDFRDRQDHWLVEWTTADGEHHTSAITKQDLTVISSGICLSGRDRDFDLQSLVGVIEKAEF